MISKNQLGALPGITADRDLTKLPQDGSAIPSCLANWAITTRGRYQSRMG